jgi:hypothetical protein
MDAADKARVSIARVAKSHSKFVALIEINDIAGLILQYLTPIEVQADLLSIWHHGKSVMIRL